MIITLIRYSEISHIDSYTIRRKPNSDCLLFYFKTGGTEATDLCYQYIKDTMFGHVSKLGGWYNNVPDDNTQAGLLYWTT